jgi:hypothetical protein
MACKRRLDRVERARQRGQQADPERSQPDPPLLAHEQGRAQALFEAFDLIGDRCLSHSQLGRRGREILGSGSSLESANRGQWRESPHQPS